MDIVAAIVVRRIQLIFIGITMLSNLSMSMAAVPIASI